MAACPAVDPASPPQFVIHAALQAGGRRGDLLFSCPAELAEVAHSAAHALGCPMGVVPQGKLDDFARPQDAATDTAVDVTTRPEGTGE